jgi:ABC-type polysaccharide transport system permease subunit
MAEQKKNRNVTRKYLLRHWELYLMLLLPVIVIIIFNYVPMGGIIIAFKDFKLRKGMFGSPWADQYGLANFIRFFSNYNFSSTLRNTLILSIYSLLVNIPCAIVLAVSLNYVRKTVFKKTVQMISYFPYFISTIVIASMINMLFNTRTGILGRLYYGISQSNILSDASMFPHLYVWSGVWQSVGFGSIIYLAALSSVDPQLHEAATIDGANILQRIWHIDLPTILPMVTIMLILNMGSVLNVGYEKVLAMQNQNNLSMAEVISTYSYKVSLAASMPDFSYGTAIGLFQSLVGLVLIMTSNKVANKLTGNGFW